MKKQIDIIRDIDRDVYYAVDMGLQGAKHIQYLYEEHHCPMNIIRSIIDVYDNTRNHPTDKQDSHGMFEYIYSIQDIEPSKNGSIVDSKHFENAVDIYNKRQTGELCDIHAIPDAECWHCSNPNFLQSL